MIDKKNTLGNLPVLSDRFNQLTQAPSRLEELRQWIISLKVKGQLTQQWREFHHNTEPTSVLLKRNRAEKVRLVKEKKIRKPKSLLPIAPDEISFEIPKDWVWCRVGGLAEIKRGKSPKYAEEGYQKMLNQKYIRWFNIETKHAKTVEKDWFTGIDSTVLTQEGDVLVNSTGEGTIGRSAIVREHAVGFLYDSHVLCVRRFVKMDLFYVPLFINSTSGQAQIENLKGAKSTKQTELGVNNLSAIVFPLPPLAEQQTIIKKVESLLAKVSELEHMVERNRQYAEQLLQSVLREVMQGAKQTTPV